MQDYPKWIETDGPGHPDNPGKVLVENEDQERDVRAGKAPPPDLNPTPEKAEDEGEKAIEDMGREELIAEIVKESIPNEISDDDLRETLREIRDRKAGVHHDDDAPADVAGDKIAPDPTDEANKGGEQDATRTAPAASPKQASDARPDDAKNKEADDKPATDQLDAAMTPADEPKTRRRAHAAPKSDD